MRPQGRVREEPPEAWVACLGSAGRTVGFPGLAPPSLWGARGQEQLGQCRAEPVGGPGAGPGRDIVWGAHRPTTSAYHGGLLSVSPPTEGPSPYTVPGTQPPKGLTNTRHHSVGRNQGSWPADPDIPHRGPYVGTMPSLSPACPSRGRSCTTRWPSGACCPWSGNQTPSF